MGASEGLLWRRGWIFAFRKSWEFISWQTVSFSRTILLHTVSFGWLVEFRGLIQLQSENFAFCFSCKEQCPKCDCWESKLGLRYYWFTRWTHRRIQQHWLGYINLCSINCLCGIRKFITSSQNLNNWPYNEPDLYTVFLLTLILIWFTHLDLCLPSFLLKLTFFYKFQSYFASPRVPRALSPSLWFW
jgi:hypothetical protein